MLIQIANVLMRLGLGCFDKMSANHPAIMQCNQKTIINQLNTDDGLKKGFSVMKFHFLQHGRLGSRCVRCCLSGSLMSFICWKSFAELVRCQVFKQLYCHCVNINTLYLIKEWTEKKNKKHVKLQNNATF